MSDEWKNFSQASLGLHSFQPPLFFPPPQSVYLRYQVPRNIKILLSALLFQSYHQVGRVMGRVLGAMTIPGRLSSNINTQRGFPCGSAGKESTYNAGDLGWEDPLEEGKAIHSSILAWRSPWTV